MFYEGLLYVRFDNNHLSELIYPIEDWDDSPGFPHIALAHDSGSGTEPFISSVRTFNGTPNGYRSPKSGNFIRYEKATDAQILILLMNWNTINRTSVKGWVRTVEQECDGLIQSEKERLVRLSTLTEAEILQMLTKEWERLFQRGKYEDAISISKEIIRLDKKSYLARMNAGITKLKYAIGCTESDSERNFYFSSALEDLDTAFDLVEQLPLESYKKSQGDKIKATCCYYMGVARSHNLMDYPGPWAMKNALGNLDASLEYYDDAEVREYRRKADSFNRRH